MMFFLVAIGMVALASLGELPLLPIGKPLLQNTCKGTYFYSIHDADGALPIALPSSGARYDQPRLLPFPLPILKILSFDFLRC